MTTQPTLPFDITASKHHGNRCSEEANLRIRPYKSSLRERVRVFVAAAEYYGATLAEMSRHMSKPMHSLSGRVSELKALGQLFDSGRTREHCAVLVSERRWVNGQ